MKTTKSVKASEVNKKWLLVDASGQTVGRLASQIAIFLRGKHKPSFTPHVDMGDNVVVVNCEKVHLSGAKWKTKYYYRHSGYIGGIRGVSAEEMRSTYPERILKIAVKGMLPKNKLSKHQILNLKVYAGAEHPHAAQNPVPAAPRTAKGDK